MLHITKHPIVFHSKGFFTISSRTLLKVRNDRFKRVSHIFNHFFFVDDWRHYGLYAILFAIQTIAHQLMYLINRGWEHEYPSDYFYELHQYWLFLWIAYIQIKIKQSKKKIKARVTIQWIILYVILI